MRYHRRLKSTDTSVACTHTRTALYTPSRSTSNTHTLTLTHELHVRIPRFLASLLAVADVARQERPVAAICVEFDLRTRQIDIRYRQ